MELIFYWPENPVYRATGSAAAEAVPQVLGRCDHQAGGIVFMECIGR